MNAVKVRKKGGLLVLQKIKFPSRKPGQIMVSGSG